MTDANEQRSEDVYFEVDDIRDESVRFKICADESWINASERAFPVKIDPEVIIGELGHSAAQFYWSYKGASSYTYDDVSVGFEVSSSSSGGSAKTRMGFIQIKLNGIPSGSIVAKAVLKMKVRFKYGWTGTDLNLHKVYKFMGGTSMLGGIEKSFSLTPTDGWLAIDLTSLVKDEMGGSMMLALEPVSGSGYITFDISTLDVQIEYFQPEDNEKTLKTYSIGGGALSVNLFNGEIGYSYASLTAAGKIPVSVYPEFKQKLFTGKGYYFFDGKQASPNFGLGKGWKLNLHEFLVNGARNKTFNGALGSDTVLRMANNNFEQYDAKAFYWKNGIKQFIKMDACKKSGDEYVKDLDGNYLYDDGGVERKAYKVYVNKNKDMLYVNEEIKEICNKILEGYTEEWYELIGQTEKKLDFSNGWNYSLEVGGKTIYVNRRFLKKEEEPGWNYWVYEYYSLEDKKIKKIGPNDMRFISENIEEIKSKGKYIIYKGYFTHSLSESGEGKLEISNLVSAHNESFYKYVYTKKIYKPCYQDTKLQKYIPEELVKAEQLYTQYLENLNSLKMSKCYYQNAKESFYSDSKEQYDKVRDLESSGSGKTFYFNRIYETESQKLNNENVWSYDVQLEKLEKEISEVEEKLIESENTLKNLAEELKKSAVDYLVVGETTMYGYDYYGLLKQITDGTNEVNIQYLQEGIAQKQDGSFAYAEALVDGLYDKDGNALLSFEYEGNRLTKITDGEGKSIYFRYTADQLSAIADNFLYAQELPVYNENGVRINLLEAEPKTIQAGERNCIQFTYNSYHIQSVYDFLHNHLNVGYSEGKIIIKSSNYIAGVSHDCITLSSNIQNSEEETITYSYGVSASVADMHGNKSYYRFNLEGDAYLEYTTRGETNGQLKPVSAVCKTYSYDFNKIKKNTRVSVDVDAVNYIPNGNFSNGFSGWQSTTTLYTTTTESVEGTGVYMGAGKIYQEITVTEALRKRGVLAVSAWAKASCSKHVCGTDSLSCVEGKHTAGTAKFELFATLTMKDATTKTYTAIYDCRNPDWQLVSLPIVDDLKDVEKIQVGIDYTDNNDKIYIDNISLSSAEGSYKVLTVDGLVMEQSDFEEVYTVLSYQDNQPSSVKLRKANGKEVYAWYRYNSKKQILKTEDSEGNITEYTYDENGNQTQKVSYNLADPTSKLYEESRYDEKGRVIAEKDPRGGEYPETTYDYAAGSDNARRIGDTCYEYDISGNIIGKTCTGNEEDNTVNYGYTAGVLTRLENADGTTVDYTYDKKGELSSLKINGEEYAVFSIEETKDSQNVVTQTTKKVTYRGGTSDKATDITFVSFSDKDGNVTQNKVNDTIYNYTYEKNLLQSVKSASGEVLRAYEYDAERRITKEILTAGDTGVWVNYTYDDEGRILQKTFADLGPRDTTTYTYEDDKIISLNISGLLTKSNEYDILDRKRKEEVSFGGKKYQTKYEYL
ncbi:MAG: RHS repeat protein, partial [Firmicutes bacterium]|nr:RHS repeat protein [Bacillota bacterium]